LEYSILNQNIKKTNFNERKYYNSKYKLMFINNYAMEFMYIFKNIIVKYDKI